MNQLEIKQLIEKVLGFKVIKVTFEDVKSLEVKDDSGQYDDEETICIESLVNHEIIDYTVEYYYVTDNREGHEGKVIGYFKRTWEEVIEKGKLN